jgi:hypothetical protein
MSDEKASVAPVKETTICPRCYRHGFSFENMGGRYGSNVCHWRNCSYSEQVTSDHVPRQWSEAELRELFTQVATEVAIKVSKTHKNGQPVLGGTSAET